MSPSPRRGGKGHFLDAVPVLGVLGTVSTRRAFSVPAWVAGSRRIRRAFSHCLPGALERPPTSATPTPWTAAPPNRDRPRQVAKGMTNDTKFSPNRELSVNRCDCNRRPARPVRLESRPCMRGPLHPTPPTPCLPTSRPRGRQAMTSACPPHSTHPPTRCLPTFRRPPGDDISLPENKCGGIMAYTLDKDWSATQAKARAAACCVVLCCIVCWCVSRLPGCS